jgi:uncharacterized membrane protein
MGKVTYALIAGILGAGIVHIATLLLIPSVSSLDTWTRLSALGNPNEFHRIDHGGDTAASIRALDPTFESAACRFNLEEGPIEVLSAGLVPFWSLSIYNRNGENVFSINDRTANQTDLSVTVATAPQIVELKKSLAPELETSIVAETEMSEGFVVLRAFAENDGMRPTVIAFLDRASCDLY